MLDRNREKDRKVIPRDKVYRERQRMIKKIPSFYPLIHLIYKSRKQPTNRKVK